MEILIEDINDGMSAKRVSILFSIHDYQKC